MLPPMSIPGAAAVLLLAAGLALGVWLAALAPGARARARRRATAPPPPDAPVDDLPGFLAAPPGSDGQPALPRPGWAVLSAPPAPPPASEVPLNPRRGRVALIAGLTALVLLAASAAVVAAADPRHPAPAPGPRAQRQALRLPAVPPAPSPGDPGAGELAAATVPTGAHGVTADLTFAGIVLERRAIGVTAAYAHVRLSDDDGASLAHVELVTFNCLADAAPPDPVAAGCSRVVPQYAELTSPALQVTRSRDGGLAMRGRFPTYVRPNGTPAAWTGEVYALRIEVAPTTETRPGSPVPVAGFLYLGSDRARTTAVSVVRPGT